MAAAAIAITTIPESGSGGEDEHSTLTITAATIMIVGTVKEQQPTTYPVRQTRPGFSLLLCPATKCIYQLCKCKSNVSNVIIGVHKEKDDF
jgi:hypothetical protein